MRRRRGWRSRSSSTSARTSPTAIPGAEDPRKLHELAELCGARLRERYDDQPGAVRREAVGRLEQELRIIEKLNLAGFFVLHHEMLELAREVAVEVRGRGSGGAESPRAVLPPGRGRGSSVSSIVCYLTGLSHVDPIANELAIGRFLSEDLKALPDIDLDFPRDIREVLIPRVSERFGKDRAALVAAFPTYRARGAIRELGQGAGAAARVRSSGSRAAARAGMRAASGVTSRRPAAARPLGRPLGVAGAAGGAGARAAAPPVAAPGRDDRRHAAADRLLSGGAGGDGGALHRAVGQGLVRRRGLPEDRPARARDALCGRALRRDDRASTRGERIDLSRIPHEDPATYDAIQNAETTGVFQIESRAQMQSLLRTRPENLKDIAIQVAIVRPGPIQGGAVNPYIERRQRLRVDPDFQIPYEHPSLEPALRETLGAIIFQDQVLEVAAPSPGSGRGRPRTCGGR